MVASSIGHIFVLLLDILARLHELGHLVAIEHLLLVLGKTARGVLGAVAGRVVHLILHLLLDRAVAGLAFGAGVDFAELLQEVVRASQVLEEVLVLRTLQFA